MSPLRQRMIDEMTLRGMSPRTHESYLGAVYGLARHYKQSPDQLSIEQVRAYLLHLERERHLSWNSLNVAVSGLRFLYFQTLGWEQTRMDIPPRKAPTRLPEVLSREEVEQLLMAVDDVKHRTILMTIYAAGLRITEALNLRVRHIDSARMMIRVEQGKGKKDRLWAAAHKPVLCAGKSYVPRSTLRFQETPAVAECYSCRATRRLHITIQSFLDEDAFDISPKEDPCWKTISN